jgi:hypothetical protein
MQKLRREANGGQETRGALERGAEVAGAEASTRNPEAGSGRGFCDGDI